MNNNNNNFGYVAICWWESLPLPLTQVSTWGSGLIIWSPVGYEVEKKSCAAISRQGKVRNES